MSVTFYVYPMETYVTGLPYGGEGEFAVMAQTFYCVPGYEEDVRYLSGAWDGREQLLQRFIWGVHNAHRFPTGLLQRVQTILTARGIPFTVYSQVPEWKRDPELLSLMHKPLSVRPYQVQGVMSLLQNGTRRGGVLQVATGGGKTRMAAKLTQIMQMPTVFLVNQKDLQEQTIREFEEMLGCEVGRVGGGKCDIKPITVATIQTIAMAAGYRERNKPIPAREALTTERNTEILKMMSRAGLVIVDECHGVPAGTARSAVSTAINAHAVVGLSASPWRDDGLDILIEAVCGPTTYVVTASDLIKLGFLVRPEIHVHNMPMPADFSLNRASDKFHELYRAWVVADDYRNGYIANLAAQHVARGEVGIVLVKHIEHGERLAQLIPQAVFMHGKLSNKKRKEIVAAVRSGEIKVLIGTSLADQGLDIPVASFLILAGGGKSSTRALQRIGRVLRLYEGKTRATVHDIVDQHGIMKRHYSERLRLYKTEPEFIIRVQNAVAA